MRGNDAYAVLGLRPGAERAEIDQAYRRLIKRYHPDSAGGDAGRAAEINRAYSELRARPRVAPGVPPKSPPPPRPRPSAMPREVYARPRSSWRAPVFGVIAVATAALMAASATMTDLTATLPGLAPAESVGGVGRPRVADSALEDPLAVDLIEASVSDARRLLEANDPAGAAEFSRACLSRLNAKPSVPLFDSCAAYDEAVALLGIGNSEFETGPFNPLAVSARQVGAARLLSADDFEAESRLQQIRSRVHMALLPQIASSSRESVRRVATRPPPRRMVRSARPVYAPIQSRPRPPAQAAPRIVEARPQPVPPPAAPPRRATVAAAPPPPRPAPPAAEPAAKPAWQQPIKPAWQRPLR